MPGTELVFKIKADFLKALAHPLRLAILERLKDKEAPVGRMVADLGAEQTSLSKHLAILRQAGLVVSRQQGTTVYYAVRDNDVFKVLKPITEMLRKNLRESQQILARLGKS